MYQIPSKVVLSPKGPLFESTVVNYRTTVDHVPSGPTTQMSHINRVFLQPIKSLTVNSPSQLPSLGVTLYHRLGLEFEDLDSPARLGRAVSLARLGRWDGHTDCSSQEPGAVVVLL